MHAGYQRGERYRICARAAAIHDSKHQMIPEEVDEWVHATGQVPGIVAGGLKPKAYEIRSVRKETLKDLCNAYRSKS